MGRGVSGAVLHATMRPGGGDATASAEGCECSFCWIWSRWCMLGNEDEPSGPDAWAARSWRVGARRAYAHKLAKIAEFQEAYGETSLVGVLAEFLAVRAEADGRQSTLHRYNAAVRAAEDLGWVGPVVHQLHKRIAEDASKVGFRPYLPPEGWCVLVERAQMLPGSLLMACVAVLCWVLWLRVGKVFGLCMLDVSLPLLMQFWNSKTGEEGWPSRLLSPWADGFQEALLQWAEAKGCERATTCSLDAVLGWNTRSRRSWVSRLGGTAGGILCAGVATLRVTLATPDAVFPKVGEMAQCRHGPAICDSVPRRCRREPSSIASSGGAKGRDRGVHALGGLGSQYVPHEAEPLPAAFHPPVWPEDLSDPPPPFGDRWRRGSHGKSRVADSSGSHSPQPPSLHPPFPLHPQTPRRTWLRNCPLQRPFRIRRGGGSMRCALGGCNLLLPSGFAPAPRPPALSSRDSDGRADQRETAQLIGRCSALKREAGPLEWWAVLCV